VGVGRRELIRKKKLRKKEGEYWYSEREGEKVGTG